jgi:hypothetical protein
MANRKTIKLLNPERGIDGGWIADTPEAINQMRLITLRSALELETMGMKRGGTPVSVIVRDLIGTKTRNKKQLLAQFDKWLETAQK